MPETRRGFECTCELGNDQQDVLHSQCMVTRIQATRDRKSYDLAKGQQSLGELRHLPWSYLLCQQWEAKKKTEAKVRLPPRDWRFDKLEKARLWASMHERKRRQCDHVAVERLAEHAQFFMEQCDMSDIELNAWGPYGAFVIWAWRMW
jgi:hypothetical protein